ncbi:MAG: hypothetical protein CSB55_03940 [Candidatus Cloacimonadota bacterium]|nr:MAG: hypothetical protein CSB55_03940 [Candidatus Cloacimonadota bacterium]
MKIKSIKQASLVMIADIFQKAVFFIITFMTVRLVSKENYGAYSFASTVLNLFLIFSGLGLSTGFMQYASYNISDEERYKILGTSSLVSISSSIFFGLILIFAGSVNLFKIDLGNTLIICMSMLLALKAISDLLMKYYRCVYNYKKYLSTVIISNLFYLISSFLFIRFWDIYGLISARYLFTAVIIILGINVLKKVSFKLNWSRQKWKSFISFSLSAVTANSVSAILVYADIFLLGQILSDSSVLAEYRVAGLLPLNLIIIPSSLMMFFYPKLVKLNKELEYFKKYLMIVGILFVINTIIFLFFTFTAEWYYPLVFGKNYSDSLPVFYIMMAGYLINGTLRISAGNFLATAHKIKINIYIALFSGILNIALNIMLIPEFGSIGAAVASLSVFILGSIVSNVYIFNLYKKMKVQKSVTSIAT